MDIYLYRSIRQLLLIIDYCSVEFIRLTHGLIVKNRYPNRLLMSFLRYSIIDNKK